MKILAIGGRNLASLAAEFRIDFTSEPLASAGLFAISGPTGAGKSTLLDALCLALYDATPRLLKAGRGASQLPDVGSATVAAQDPRTLLRRGAGEGHAEVDFVGTDGCAYRARWSVRRARGKAGGALQPSSMTLHRLPELAPLGGTKTEVAAEIVARIGLTFDQFTRAVLLAQNEFSAFLKTEDNERGELLETLTGSAVYSAISKRAYARFKAEQEALARLSARLADQTPLAAEARAALDAAGAEAQAALAALDRRRDGLEQQLRWHQEADKLRRNEALAEQALAAAQGALAAALPRRRRLASIDALQPARALLADCARLDSERTQAASALGKAEAELHASLAAQALAGGALTAAQARCAAADDEQRACAPRLDLAKALDAHIAAIVPTHHKARASRDAHAAELALAAQALQAKAEALAATRAELASRGAWLERQRTWETLAAQWPRWESLLTRAEQAALQDTRAAAAEREAGQRSQAAGAGAAEVDATLAAAAAELDARQAARQQAIAALAGFDGEALRAERLRLQRQRELIDGAGALWSGLSATGARLEQAVALAAQLESAQRAAAAALDAARAAEPALAAAQHQAERSLSAAELACAASVVELRAHLEDGAPCPVCGSPAHPYAHQGGALDQMLASLRAEVAHCRAQWQENTVRQATERTLAAGSAEQLAQSQRERAGLDTALAQAAMDWDAHPLAAPAPPAALRAQWLADQRADNQQALDAHEQREHAASAAAAARDAAQHEVDRLGAEHARRHEQAIAARAALAQARAEHAASGDKRGQAGAALAALLAELDAAFDGASAWRQDWSGAPAAFRQERAAEASQWRAHSGAHAASAALLSTLDAEHAAAQARQARAAQAHSASEAEFAQLDASLAAQRGQRQALWEGRPVAAVESCLAQAIHAARAALGQAQEAAQQAALADTRVRVALAHGQSRLGALDLARAAAGARLDDWLARHAGAHPQLDSPSDVDALGAMLAGDGADLAQERLQLGALDAGAAQAATVLQERRAQREAHLGDGASDGAAAAALAEQLDAVLAERREADGAAAALRLNQAQDDERRQRAQAVLAEIDAQQQVERRWGRMNELIGSADGKKFRNYAQQFTLDVLLGYANRHLQQLARRYRLERVGNAAAPSLALMVRDQDMGGEIRSVNSLSGGESFLVSLALALGLASLSSNRVRVESLFIDEGFGSLDSDTLRVAMDALDGLQSMGRKVGVISHVQEMTERIATRIVVQPGGAGTSTVTVQ